jgi:hypothetical protein
MLGQWSLSVDVDDNNDGLFDRTLSASFNINPPTNGPSYRLHYDGLRIAEDFDYVVTYPYPAINETTNFFTSQIDQIPFFKILYMPDYYVIDPSSSPEFSVKFQIYSLFNGLETQLLETIIRGTEALDGVVFCCQRGAAEYSVQVFMDYKYIGDFRAKVSISTDAGRTNFVPYYGQSGSIDFTITDDSLPEISSIIAQTGTIEGTTVYVDNDVTSINIDVNAVDDVSVEKFSWMLNGTGMGDVFPSLGGGKDVTQRISSIPLQTGSNSISVVAHDIGNNSSSAETLVVVRAEPPPEEEDEEKTQGPPALTDGDCGGGNSWGAGQGNPINHANGNKYQKVVDYVGTGPMPLYFCRTYNSGAHRVATINGAMGTHWRHHYQRAVLPIANSQPEAVRVFRPDGKAYTFERIDGQWTSTGDIIETLTEIPGGWTYRSRDDITETYDTAGKLITLTDRAGFPGFDS